MLAVYRRPCASTDLNALQAVLAVCEGVPHALYVSDPALLEFILQVQDAVDCSGQLPCQLCGLKQTEGAASQQQATQL